MSRNRAYFIENMIHYGTMVIPHFNSERIRFYMLLHRSNVKSLSDFDFFVTISASIRLLFYLLTEMHVSGLQMNKKLVKDLQIELTNFKYPLGGSIVSKLSMEESLHSSVVAFEKEHRDFVDFMKDFIEQDFPKSLFTTQ